MYFYEQLIIELGLDERCREEIDEIYSKNEVKYYDAYIHSEMYGNLTKEMFPIAEIEAINKVIGIVEVCQKEGNLMPIETIIKAQNPSILRYAKTKHVIDIDLFFKKYYDIDKITELQLYATGISLMYAARRYGKDVQGSALGLIVRYGEKIVNVADANIRLQNQSRRKLNMKAIMWAYDALHIKRERLPMIQDNIINDIIDYEVFAKMRKVYGDRVVDEELYSQEQYLNYRNKSFKQGVAKYIGSLSGMFTALGLNSELLFQKEMTSHELDVIFDMCYEFKEGNELNDDEFVQLLVTAIFTNALMGLYYEAKDLYLNKSKEDKFLYLTQYEAELKSKAAAIKDETGSYRQQIYDKDRKIEILNERIKKLEHENRKLCNNQLKQDDVIKDLEESIEQQREQIDLLKSIIDEEYASEKRNVSMDEIVSSIGGYKIALFGGHNTTRNKLQSSLVNLIMYDKNTSDISAIANVDYVFINTDWFSHSFMKKVLSYCNKYDKPFRYIGGTNYESVITQMYEAIKKEKEEHEVCLQK